MSGKLLQLPQQNSIAATDDKIDTTKNDTSDSSKDQKNNRRRNKTYDTEGDPNRGTKELKNILNPYFNRKRYQRTVPTRAQNDSDTEQIILDYYNRARDTFHGLQPTTTKQLLERPASVGFNTRAGCDSETPHCPDDCYPPLVCGPTWGLHRCG